MWQYSADFIADSTLGWNVNGHVLWKDWTYVGIDLAPLHGRRVYLQLTTYDCGEGSHYGYAYFNFSCGRKQLIADRCGEGVNTLTAPLGFNYAWHDAVTDSLISTERSLSVDSTIDCYYSGIETTEGVRRQWDELLIEEFEQPLLSNGHSVGPLLTSTWGQVGYYNNNCPFDTSFNTYTRVGDVAIALAQVLRYWQRPTTGIGSHSYVDPTYGMLTANFGATTYQWSLMPDVLDWYASWTQRNAVAQLLFHCGVATETQYGVNNSTSHFFCNDTNATDCLHNAFWRYFGYRSDIQVLYRDSMTATQWRIS